MYHSDELYPPGPREVPGDLTTPTPAYERSSWLLFTAERVTRAREEHGAPGVDCADRLRERLDTVNRSTRARLLITCLIPLAASCADTPPATRDAGVDGCVLDPTSCAPPPDPCDPSPCTTPNRTRCVVEGAAAVCLCDGGHHEEEGACVPDVACVETTCSSHGTCTSSGEPPVLECACDAGYAGAFCDECDEAAGWFPDGAGGCDDDPCDPSPCMVAGRTRCEADGATASCLCDAGRHDEGGECVPDLTCTETTCAGHGTCTSEGGGVSCACDPGFDGASCERCGDGYHEDGEGGCTTDVCVPNPCTSANRSACVPDGVGGARCECDPGFHLEGDACVTDEVCTATTCSGHGSCSVAEGRTVCACDAAFAGLDCSSCAAGYHDDGAGGCTTDACVPDPCTTAGRTVCDDSSGSARCLCDPGLHEDGAGGCTADPCRPDPCAASGQACRVVGGAAECYVPACSDGNPCTADAFTGGACVSTPLGDGTPCASTACLLDQVCTAGTCGGGAPVDCDDGNPCTRDVCDASAGCSSTHDDALVPDDGVACTADACSAGMASHLPEDAMCDDGAWCTGAESCAPTASGADARGCVSAGAPRPPAPDATCRWYVCDEAARAFVRHAAPVGAACSDAIGCTSGDACDGTGACIGAAGSACATRECTSPGALPATIDLGIAHVTGTITLDGGALPPAQPSSAGDITIYAVAKDTGARHTLGYVRYRYDGPGSYPLFGTDGTLDTRVLPGVYDILYQRNYNSDYNSTSTDDPTDPYVNGHRILRTNVVLGPGDNVLDLDLREAGVQGTITLEGGALPATQPSSAGDITIYALSEDTGARHTLGYVRYRYDGPGSYPLFGTDGTLDTRVLPGVYDILYSRNYNSDYNSTSSSDPTDPYVNGYRVLREDVTFTAGNNTLNLDLGEARVQGTITLEGGALPATQPSSAGDITIYAVSEDTGARHTLGYVRYRYDGPGSYPLFGTDGTLDTRVLPGVYDILYARNYNSDYNSTSSSDAADPYVNGYRVLREDVTFTGGANTLNLDLGEARVQGTITLDGGALPATRPSSAGDITIYAVSVDTGARHTLGYVRYRYDGPGSYPLFGTDGTLDTRVLPGVYDILYSRNYNSDYNSTSSSDPADPYVNGYRVLREDVTFTAGNNTLNLDLGEARVQGIITLDGGALPATQPSSAGDITIYAVSEDTGARHTLGYVRYRYDGPGSYPLFGTDGTLDARVLPGVYDILYARNYNSDYNSTSSDDAADPYVNGYRILRQNVTFAAGTNTLNLDLARRRVLATVTLAGGALPASQPSSAGDITLYAVARDTEARHTLGYIRYRYAGPASYPRFGTDGRLDTRVLPGTYDLLYSRNYNSDYNSTSSDDPTDPYVNGYRVIAACIAP